METKLSALCLLKTEGNRESNTPKLTTTVGCTEKGKDTGYLAFIVWSDSPWVPPGPPGILSLLTHLFSFNFKLTKLHKKSFPINNTTKKASNFTVHF